MPKCDGVSVEVLSFHYVGSRNEPQEVRLDGRCLSPPSHLSGFVLTVKFHGSGDQVSSLE